MLAVIMVLGAGLLASCTTLDQRIVIAPIPSSYPISASSSLYVGSRVIPESSMKKVRSFDFTTYFAPKMSAKEAKLNLVGRLNQIVDSAGANGIIKLKLIVRDVNTSTVNYVEMERSVGGMAAAFGLIAVGFSALESNSTMGSSSGSGLLTGGIIATALGAGLVGVSFIHQAHGAIGYSIEVQGVAVDY